MEHLRVGDKVRVVKEDPRDERYGIPDDKRWQVGEEFIVREIVIEFGEIFLHDGKGHNVYMKRCERINT